MMIVKVVLAYLVIACAFFAWGVRLVQSAHDEPNIIRARDLAPKSTALMLSLIVLLLAIFWPATIAGRFVLEIVARSVKRESEDDDDDDGNAPQVT